MAAIKALQQWCKQQCDGYRDVSITNMTTSFRDGLAFCAILHKHRPDLLNFNSLSKENVYENNHLAFHVAEEKLGIPALLDAEDMVKLRVPDRLSILTYVSQYYNYFHGRSPIGGLAAVKRPPPDTVEEPAGKKVTNDVLPTPQAAPRLPQPAPRTNGPAPKSNIVIENPPVRAGIREIDGNSSVSSNCMICGKHVHLVQRHMADGKLYHRNCFKCKQCSRTLQPGEYKAGDGFGSFICTHHHPVAPTSPVTRTIMPAAPHENKSSWVTPRTSVQDQNNKTQGNKFGLSGAGSTGQDPTNRTAVGFVSNNQKLQHSTGAPDQEEKPSRNILNSTYSPSSTNTALQHQTNKMAGGFVSSRKDNTGASISTGSDQPNKVGSNYLNTSVANEQPKKLSTDLLTNKGKFEPKKDPSSQPIKSPSFTINSTPTGKLTTPSAKDEPKETSPKPWELSAAKNKAARDKFFQTSPAVVEPANKISSVDMVSPKSSDGPGKPAATSLSPGIPDSIAGKDKARNVILKTLGGPTSPKLSEETENPNLVYRPHRVLDAKTAEPSISSTKVEPARPVPKERKIKNETPKSVSKPEPPVSTPTYTSWGISTPGSGNNSSTTKPYLSKSGSGQKADEISSKGPTPNSNVSKQETAENWRQNLKSVTKTPETQSLVQPKVYPLPKVEKNGDKMTPSTQKAPTVSNSVKTDTTSPGKENKPSESLTPSAAQSKEDKASSSPIPPRKKLLPVNLDLINDWPKPVQKWQDVPLKDDIKRPAAHLSANEIMNNNASSNKARPEYIPEEAIQRQLQIIEQELDALEQQGVEMEKQLRSCDGDESEDVLMVDWFKLIHEKQLLLRQESELNYISKQQALEDQQCNVDTELRNLMNKPDHLKTPADREREKELLDQLLLIVNDRSGIIDCLDEDRIREKEEDEVMNAMIRRHSENNQKEASPEPNLKRRSRFSFSGLFKPKDKSKT